jgi:hypothetical protein
MKTTLIFVAFLLATAGAQQTEQPLARGKIYGIVIGHDGQPARGIGLTAQPLGVLLATVLPHTKTNQRGEYRFENIPWLGRYTVYADDEEAGYSSYSTGPAGLGNPAEVELSPVHIQAEFNLRLPQQAGFLRIHLTNRNTGVEISGVEIEVMAAEAPGKPLFGEGRSSNRVLLIPPDKDLLLHVTSWGFREWDQSVRRGKPLRMLSGSHKTLEVQLEPSD